MMATDTCCVFRVVKSFVHGSGPCATYPNHLGKNSVVFFVSFRVLSTDQAVPSYPKHLERI
jgi:hypothetical protein